MKVQLRNATPFQLHFKVKLTIFSKNHLTFIFNKVPIYHVYFVAGWSSLVARQAHNLKVLGSNPSPAPNVYAG